MTDQNPYGTRRPATTRSPPRATAPQTQGQRVASQLQTMINDITTQAAPVARQVAAKAAELTAVAAVKAGPIAQRAAEVTTDAGQKLAERAQSLAAELRAADAGSAPATRRVGQQRGHVRRRGDLRGRHGLDDRRCADDLVRGRHRRGRPGAAAGHLAHQPPPHRDRPSSSGTRAVVAYTRRP